jgi:uncharacterized surface protein with fasciclin (FAS1) repeats
MYLMKMPMKMMFAGAVAMARTMHAHQACGHWPSPESACGETRRKAACRESTRWDRSAEAGADKPADIIQTAISNGSLGTLVTALKVAGLVETLSITGPFTVFAPTDDAFSKLPSGTLENLLKPENKKQLVAILTSHIVPGRALSRDFEGKTNLRSVEGSELSVDASDGLKIGNAKVVKADIAASNGIIHVIDAVITPKI